jgi:hypothetical protein
MKRALLCVLLASTACEPSARPAPAKAEPAPTEQVFLREWFALPSGGRAKRCRIDDARQVLAESAQLPYAHAHVRPDVPAVQLSVSCEDASGHALPSRDALPLDTTLLLVRGNEARAPRPPAAGDAPDQLVFELASATTRYLRSPRRFDVRSGKPVVPRETELARLRIKARSLALDVVLRERFQDAAFDRFMDALALALAEQSALDALAHTEEGAAALRDVAKTFHEVRARFQPARLELARADAAADAKSEGVQITLSLTRPRAHARQFEVARLTLGLIRAPDGALRVGSFENRAEARNALQCEQLEETLARDLLASRPSAQAGEEHCNALGILLPLHCRDVEPSLLARALQVGARCRALVQDAPESKTRVPDDFQLTMRRGRSARGLDREPRYVVSLFHQGQVVFHGRHWVTSQERSDGRTSLALLAGLYERVERLDWFERRGGQYDPEGCVPSEDDGDVITVIARGRQRMVLSRDGCRGPFSETELTGLRRHVELVAGISGWTEPQRAANEGVDPHAEQWAIAE